MRSTDWNGIILEDFFARSIAIQVDEPERQRLSPSLERNEAYSTVLDRQFADHLSGNAKRMSSNRRRFEIDLTFGTDGYEESSTVVMDRDLCPSTFELSNERRGSSLGLGEEGNVGDSSISSNVERIPA